MKITGRSKKLVGTLPKKQKPQYREVIPSERNQRGHERQYDTRRTHSQSDDPSTAFERMIWAEGEQREEEQRYLLHIQYLLESREMSRKIPEKR